MNTFQVLIGGQRIHNVSLPFKYGNFLDQQLDFATLTLTRINVKNYPPCTPVIVIVYSENTANGVTYSQAKRFEYIVQGDNSRESPVGSGFYRHEITLIEPTKLLEIPLESLCFTNVGLKDYKKQEPPIIAINDVGDSVDPYQYMDTVPANFLSPQLVGNTITLFNLDPSYYSSSLGTQYYYTGNVTLNGQNFATINENGTLSKNTVET